MANFTKIGISMLNIDDIAEYLRHACNFMLRSDKSYDTEKVFGVPANHIAVADTSRLNADGSVNLDRETVKNALHLDGHDVSYFVTKDYGKDLDCDMQDAKSVINTEVADLRDELYQLRTELVKRGMLESYSPYAGFYDVFHTGDPAHVYTPVFPKANSKGNEAQRTAHVTDVFFDTIEVGDHLYLLDGGVGTMLTVTGKRPDHETLEFNQGAGFDIKTTTKIYRSHGTVLNGTYAFAALLGGGADTTKAMYTGLDDDTYSEVLPLDSQHPGYAYSFRIPKQMQKSYLSKFEIQVQMVGQPGTLVAYVIREKDIEMWNKLRRVELGLEDLPESLDPTLPRKRADLIVGQSQPLAVSPNLGMHIEEFTFRDTVVGGVDSTYGFSNPGAYPYLADQDGESGYKVRYCIIIEPHGRLDKYDPDSRGNYYLIQGIKAQGDEKSDLQINNTLYRYDADAEAPITTDDSVNTMDLYYGVTLLKAVERSFEPLNRGIYTARFSEPAPITATRARLMLRIDREPMLRVATTGSTAMGGPMAANSALVVESMNGVQSHAFGNAKGETVVIGKTINQIANVNENGCIIIRDGMYVEPAAPVYPIGYQVAIKAYRNEFEPKSNRWIKKYQRRFTMPLTAVIPDSQDYKDNARISDRLIFEADLQEDDGSLKEYDSFELEIYWHRICNEEKNSTARIYDLTLSLDRALERRRTSD